MRQERCLKCGHVLQEGQVKCPRCWTVHQWEREGGPEKKPENERWEKEPEE